MLVATITFEVKPEKRDEFVSAVSEIVQSLRWSAGCLGCRLVSDCEDSNSFSLSSDWDSRAFLDRYLASPEYRILEGTRFLLRHNPGLSIDEVVSRGKAAHGTRP